ncbi:hypothetical protein [Mycoplasma sp. VS403A]|uniref:hypothetical protein n=1 Tax=Mycoplasma sp. VS403A TaxID=3401668 RepID=UPI003AAF5F2D
MAQKEISFLSDLGINFQAFQESEFNTQKPFKIPKKLYSIMPSAGSEEIFTKTLFSVYNSCNALINNVINLLALKLDYDAAKFIEAAGKERIALLKSAVFNEVNYRFTTQTTPELFNRLTIAPNNAQILGTPRDFYLAEQYLNPIAKKFLEDCEWDRLGIELGAAYSKAFEINTKVQEFKTELAKNSKTEQEEFKKQITKISEHTKTELAQQAGETANNYIQYVKTTTESNVSMLDLTFNHLQQEATKTAKAEIQKIDNYSSQTKKELDSTIASKSQELAKIAQSKTKEFDNIISSKTQELVKIAQSKTEEFDNIINSKSQNFMNKEEVGQSLRQMSEVIDRVINVVEENKNNISHIKIDGESEWEQLKKLKQDVESNKQEISSLKAKPSSAAPENSNSIEQKVLLNNSIWFEETSEKKYQISEREVVIKLENEEETVDALHKFFQEPKEILAEQKIRLTIIMKSLEEGAIPDIMPVTIDLVPFDGMGYMQYGYDTTVSGNALIFYKNDPLVLKFEFGPVSTAFLSIRGLMPSPSPEDFIKEVDGIQFVWTANWKALE